MHENDVHPESSSGATRSQWSTFGVHPKFGRVDVIDEERETGIEPATSSLGRGASEIDNGAS
jgi:hypothetical protein